MGAYYGLGLGLGGAPVPIRGSHLAVGGLLEQYPGAAAAYSLRALRNNTGNVVRVRRSSDDTEQDFTAAQVSDGSLVDFTGRENQVFPSNAQGASNFVQGSIFGVASYPTKTDNVSDPFGGTDAISLVYSGSTNERFGTNVTGNNGLVPAYTGDVTFSFWGRVPSGTLTVRSSVRSTGTADTSNKDHNFTTTWQRFEHTSSRTEANGATGFYFDSSTARTIEIYGVQMERASSAGEYQETTVGATGDGFVATWYDQSGNSNDATQATTTAQPQIVDSGALVTGGLDFDGTDDVLNTSFVPPNIATLIGVAEWDVENVATMIVGARDQTAKRSYIAQVSNGEIGVGVANSVLSSQSVVAGTEYICVGIHSGATRLISVNGSSTSDELGVSPNNTIEGYSIGALNDVGTNSSFMDGSINEVIIYNSDQSANRTAIEANIADAYGITLP